MIMKKIIFGLLLITVLTSCSNKDEEVEKPNVSIKQFSRQVSDMNRVVQTLMEEPNPKVMHDMAFGVESTRAVLCDPIGEECNLYYELVNKMVFVTNDGVLSEQDRALLTSMDNKLKNEIDKSEKILIKQWKTYLSKKAPEQVPTK